MVDLVSTGHEFIRNVAPVNNEGRLYSTNMRGFTTYIRSEHVGSNAGSQLEQKDESQENGEGDGHAVVLLDGAAAAEEGDEEDDAADDDEENRSVEELKNKFFKNDA